MEPDKKSLAVGNTQGVLYQRELTRKRISSAEGVLDGSLHRPWSKMWLKAWTPRRTSTGPWTPKTKLARQSLVRCLQRVLNGTGNTGKWTVVLGSTTASTPQSWWGCFLQYLLYDLSQRLQRTQRCAMRDCVGYPQYQLFVPINVNKVAIGAEPNTL